MPVRRIPLILLAVAILAACSPRQMGIQRMAAALSSTADAYAKDNDPEFVRLGAPSTLKMVEMLLDAQPTNSGLLMTACSGFTQYAYAFLQVDAEEAADAATAQDLRSRAGRMYARALGYCLRALEVRHTGIRKSLAADALAAAAGLSKDDVPLLYWTGIATAASVSVSENRLLRVNDLATARAMLSRALALDESWEGGAIHEAFITLDGQPRLLGGSAARAREHFKRAVELSGGQSAFAYVSMASSVSLAAKDRAEFERLLHAALAIDVDKTPRLRLANAVAQKHARYLLSRAGQLF